MQFARPLSSVPERVTANDNRVPAGRLADGVLTLRLEVRLGEWFPQAADGPSVTVPVFAEEGKAPEVPGPLVRVPAGTILDITLTNQLPDTGVTITGFGPRSADGSDSLRLPAGASRHLRYRVDSAGTYLYRGRTEARSMRRGWSFEESQLGGAVVVDLPGTSPVDRIFVLNIWADPVAERSDTTIPPRNVLAINGRSWPYTEQQTMTVGDSVRWRVVNASDRDHPMHMHGFYYRVVAQGDIARDTILAPADQRLVVTESMVPQSTMDIAFHPSQIGNWLFHCHLIYHVNPDAALTWPDGTPTAHDPGQHMAGLVLGLVVAARPGFGDAARGGAHQVRLVVREAPDSASDSGMVMSYSLGDDADDAPVALPAPTLFLTRGVPTDVTVVNQLDQPTGVHWHGLELQSPADGVAGWSGIGTAVFAPIQPGDSFVAHLIQPRAGTFIYHTHLRDHVQLNSGLYGPLIVLEPGATFHPETDHIFLLGGPLLLNGRAQPPSLAWGTGPAHRLRFINILAFGRLEWRVMSGDTLAWWRPVARDGADLPATQRAFQRASTIIDAGGAADFEVQSSTPENLRLEIAIPAGRVLRSEEIRIRPSDTQPGAP